MAPYYTRKRTPSRKPSPSLSTTSKRNDPPPVDSPGINNALELLAKSVKELAEIQASHRPVPYLNADLLPAFDPSEPTQSIKKWCARVDQLSSMFHWTPEFTIAAALSKLKGFAKTWFNCLESWKYSWPEWKEKLIAAFPPRDYCQLLEDMLARRKLPDESYLQYYHEKMVLIKACDIAKENEVSFIIHGIDDAVVANCARAMRDKTPENVLAFLVTLKTPDDAQPTGNSQSSGSKTSHSFSRKLSAHSSSTLKKGTVCHKCGKRGHFARECVAVSESSNVNGSGEV